MGARWNEGQPLTGLSRSLREPVLKCGNGAEGFGIYFPRHSGPEDSDTVGETVDTHAVISVLGGLLEPENSSVVGFFNVNETIVVCDVLKCFEFFHGNFSLRPFARVAG